MTEMEPAQRLIDHYADHFKVTSSAEDLFAFRKAKLLCGMDYHRGFHGMAHSFL